MIPECRKTIRESSFGNMIFDGPGQDEDFGLEQVSGDPADRYKFRTSPLRNVALQKAFFHNGSFTRLEDAVSHHLNVFESARNYNPIRSLVAFVRNGLLDPRVERRNLCSLIPVSLPSGMPPLRFEECPKP